MELAPSGLHAHSVLELEQKGQDMFVHYEWSTGRKPLVTKSQNHRPPYLNLRGPDQYKTHTNRVHVKRGLTVLLEHSEEHSGTLGWSSSLNPWQPREKHGKKGACMCVCEEQETGKEERRKKTLVKNSLRGKSLNYSLEKPAVETSTHTSEAEGSEHSLTSNSTSAQLLTAASSGPTGK